MTKGLDANWQAALAGQGIRTGYLARLEFATETLFITTLEAALAVSGTGDAQLDGNTFYPLTHGVMVGVGDQSYSYEGSGALTLTLAIPSSPPAAIVNAAIYPDEYLGRNAYLWRVLMHQPPSVSTAAVWGFRRIRAGAMDQVQVNNDGKQHTFALTIESHAATISAATNSTYLDQPRFDANDHSQDFAVNIANGSPAPARGTVANIIGGINWPNLLGGVFR